MDMLFASNSLWAWEAEKNFALLKERNPDMVRSTSVDGGLSMAGEDSEDQDKRAFHVDQVSGKV